MGVDDARTALRDGDVAARSAAARTLALSGDLDDLAELVARAQADKSSAVRLYAAAAAADVVSRSRGSALPADLRTSIDAWVGRTDPALNPSLLMMWSVYPERSVLSRLLRMLRDPRSEVRAGAAVAIRRMVLAAQAMDFEIAEVLVAEALQRALAPDAVVEMVRLSGEVGWTHIDDVLRKVGGQSGAIREAVDEALDRNRLRASPTCMAGYWVDLGVDVQQAGEPSGAGYLAIHAGEAATEAGPVTVTFDDGRLAVDGAPARLLFASPPGPSTERVAVLQTSARTYWRQQGEALVELIDSGVPLPGVAYASMTPDLADLEGPAGTRARVVASWGMGDLATAKAGIDDLTEKKKPRQDLWYWRARIYADLGDRDEALACVEQFLSKARASHPLRAVAEAFRGEL